MNVLVIGANGKVGRHLIRLLGQNKSHRVKALIRHSDQAEALERLGAETVVSDLEGTVGEIAAAIKGSDAIVFTAGSGGKTGADKTLLIDLDGAVKAMEAAEQAGIQRFVMVSALHAEKREQWPESIKPYYVAKHYADRLLEASNLDYTILRPGGLTDDVGTGKVATGEDFTSHTISREDVAAVVIAVLEEQQTYHRSINLVSGSTPIAEAIRL
ncbi:SDR family oxidoreductase [Paenibacillus polymyxa]|uniref:SDR family oxidoreductase n=1 Tax=Paenibacillus polymyxa TaxID=1406 RepID=UPI0004DB1946|nr:SDR family oxidoreductase [Paenibacillus polymyxa]KEO78875.1 sugar epimerase [Paenibacillus polymyxa]MCH6187835.1 SDR family oxidoreductase [Paenibacillus polymyxa]WRL57309.1 SDR family oxidoreductase [Paenibacillus polymyxa]